MADKAKATYWQRGEAIDYYNEGEAAIEAGELVSFGEAIGVAAADIAPKETGAMHIEGVFRIPKKESEKIEIGTRVCLKDGKAQKHTPGGDEDCKWLGHAVATAQEADKDVLVKINV